MEFAALVSDWEAWTAAQLHHGVPYILPGRLAPLTVAGDVGRYWEPNVWLLHENLHA
jgi:hypothetical protein